MKFRSPGDEPLHIALTSGHTLVIPPEGVEVPNIFKREAISRGAEPMAPDASDAADEPSAPVPAVDKSAEVAQAAAEKRKEMIKEALRNMLNGANEEDFTAQGAPNLKRLQAAAGFQVSRAEADAAWEEVKAEEADDNQPS